MKYAKFREGWTPVLATDHPELQVMPDIDSKWSENIEVGGLLLCSNAIETVEARKEYHREQSQRQIESVDNSYLRTNDPHDVLPSDKQYHEPLLPYP